jgi:hypothetical protein
MITPSQFPVVVITIHESLTPDEIVGRYFATAQGMRGFVKARFDQRSYCCTVISQDGGDQTRLLGINWMRGCKFFKTRAEMEAPGLEAFERGAVMGAEP